MNSNTLTTLHFGIDANRAAALTSAFHRLGYICRHTAVDEMGRMGSAIRDDKPDLVLFDEAESAIELSHCLGGRERRIRERHAAEEGRVRLQGLRDVGVVVEVVRRLQHEGSAHACLPGQLDVRLRRG